MVLIKTSIPKALWPVAISSVMLIDSCNSNDPDTPITKTDLLIGNWEMVELGNYEFKNDTYIFGFKSNLDFQICITYREFGYVYCDPDDKGTWNWVDANEEKVLIHHLGEMISIDIDNMDSENLHGDITFHYNSQYENTSSVRFLKVK